MSASSSLVPRKGSSFWLTRAAGGGAAGQILSEQIGSRRRRWPWLRVSPNRVLSLRIQRKEPWQRSRYGYLFRSHARLTNERLPLMTYQTLIRRQDLRDETGLADIVKQSDPAVWRDRLNSLATRGWTEQDLDDWIWILSAETPDGRIERFKTKGSQKPLFLIMLLLQRSHNFKSPDSLVSILDYLNKYYLTPTPGSHVQLGWDDSKTSLSMDKFLIILRRLVIHVQRIWPRSIVTLAQLVREHIRCLPGASRHGGSDRIYSRQCVVFNTALQLFSRPAPMNPVENMEFNWQAQRLLLSMSDNMKRPLIVSRMSYRGIRKVMIGHKKNTAEKAVAQRYAKTWPPYRQDFDGLDTKRTPEDDKSRGARVGVLQVEAGYDEDDYDKALGALSGTTAESPTVQTRSLPPREWKHDEEREHFYTLWAMKVRSTRNAREAWRAFNSFSDAEPDLSVYTEMIIKLLAREVDNPKTILAGDAREVFPVHNENFSEYELYRLTPPTLDELYNHMISRGIKPQGICLRQLVSTARSVEEGLRYVRDSGLDHVALSQITEEKTSERSDIQKIPLPLFQSVVQLLCRLQPNRRGNRRLADDELYPIFRAIKLTKSRLLPETPSGATFKPPWHYICRALARPYIAVINADQLDNDLEALAMLLDIYKHTETTIGVDTEIFIYLCRAVQKVLVSVLDMYGATFAGAGQHSISQLMQSNSRLGSLLHHADQSMASAFSKMVSLSPQADGPLTLPIMVYEVTPIHLHVYMRSLAFLDNTTGMVSLLEWMLKNKSYVDEQAERIGNRAYSMIAKTLCAFEAFAGPKLDASAREELDESMMRASETNQPWRWPTTKEIEQYVDSDKRGGSQKLHRRAIAAWWQANDKNSNTMTPEPGDGGNEGVIGRG